MKRENIIRAWRDEAYRLSLSDAERALLPESPVGSIELDDAALGGAAGGMRPMYSPAVTYCTWCAGCSNLCR